MENIEIIKRIQKYFKENIDKEFSRKKTTYVEDKVRIIESELGYLRSVGIKKNNDLYLYFESIDEYEKKNKKRLKCLLQFSPYYVFDAEINLKGVAVYLYNTRSQEDRIVKVRWIFKEEYILKNNF